LANVDCRFGKGSLGKGFCKAKNAVNIWNSMKLSGSLFSYSSRQDSHSVLIKCLFQSECTDTIVPFQVICIVFEFFPHAFHVLSQR
jgi:hypothetical protein